MIDELFAAYMASPDKETLRQLMAVSCEGHLCLDIGDAPFSLCKGIVRENNLLYLARNWAYETKVIHELKRLMQAGSPTSYTSAELTEEQTAAVNCALSNSVSIITGGPGTGKTFVIRHLLQAMENKNRIVLMAPTGKAVSRIKELNPLAKTGTMHTLLGIRSERDFAKGSSYLSADLIVVDESSMIDAKLLAFFLASVPALCKIVFLGDADQLPPVGSGSLFADLVDLLPTARLTKCLRSDRKEILDLAQAILRGDEIHPDAASCDVGQLAQDGYTILSCIREGPWGVDTLNQRLAQSFSVDQVPILITKNDVNLGLYNGDIGVIWKTEGMASFSSGKTIPTALLPVYEPAYCLSVHKSQGSEFARVAVLVPPGSERFGREILYTAVTRAKDEVKIFADEETLKIMTAKSCRRRSGLRQRWGFN